MVDTTRYLEWLQMGKNDIIGAQILFEHGADYGLVCFHCQQAIEKYLKGYLIAKTGVLQEGHSLIKLCKKAIEFDKGFKDFIKDCAFVNAYYIETRYPSEDPFNVTGEEVQICFSIVDNIVRFIDKLVKDEEGSAK